MKKFYGMLLVLVLNLGLVYIAFSCSLDILKIQKVVGVCGLLASFGLTWFCVKFLLEIFVPHINRLLYGEEN